MSVRIYLDYSHINVWLQSKQQFRKSLIKVFDRALIRKVEESCLRRKVIHLRWCQNCDWKTDGWAKLVPTLALEYPHWTSCYFGSLGADCNRQCDPWDPYALNRKKWAYLIWQKYWRIIIVSLKCVK